MDEELLRPEQPGLNWNKSPASTRLFTSLWHTHTHTHTPLLGFLNH